LTADPRGTRSGAWLAFALVFAISLLRDPNALALPPLLFEDGRDVFGFFYEHRELSALWRAHAGYLVFVPNSFGWLALAAPVELAPVLLALFPLTLASAAFAWLARAEYRFLIADDRARAALAVALALFPIANDRFLCNTMYSVWSALLLLVFASVAPAPASAGSALVRGLGTSALIASHALSALAIPIFAGLAAIAPRLLAERRGEGEAASALPRDPRVRVARAYHAGLAVVAIAYQIWGVDRSALAWTPPLALARRTFALLFDRVAAASLCGDAALLWLRGAFGPGSAQLLGALLCAVPIAAAWRARARLGAPLAAALAALAWISVAATASCVLGRGASEELIASGRADRFFWVQRACFLALFAWSAHALAAPRLARMPRSARVVCGSAALLALALVNAANARNYRVRADEGARVAAFAAELARQERALGGRAGVSAVLERGRWSIEIGRGAGSRNELDSAR
jgi:hypothetical protein